MATPFVIEDPAPPVVESPDPGVIISPRATARAARDVLPDPWQNLKESERKNLESMFSRTVGVAGRGTTFNEVFQSTWDKASFDTVFGVGAPLREAYSELHDGLRAAVGGDLAAFAKSRNIQWIPAEDATRLHADLRGLGQMLDALPEEARKSLEPLRDVRRNAALKAQAVERRADEIYARSGEGTWFGDLSAWSVSAFAGSMRQMLDPYALAMNVATGGIGGRVLSGAVLPMLARQAAAGALSQAAGEPYIEPARAELGLEAGWVHAFKNIAASAVGAAIVAGGSRALVWGVSRAFSYGSPLDVDVRAPGGAPVRPELPGTVVEPASARPATVPPRPGETAIRAADANAAPAAPTVAVQVADTSSAAVQRLSPIRPAQASRVDAPPPPAPREAPPPRLVDEPGLPGKAALSEITLEDAAAVGRQMEREIVMGHGNRGAKNVEGQAVHADRINAARDALEKGGGLPPDNPAEISARMSVSDDVPPPPPARSPREIKELIDRWRNAKTPTQANQVEGSPEFEQRVRDRQEMRELGLDRITKVGEVRKAIRAMEPGGAEVKKIVRGRGALPDEKLSVAEFLARRGGLRPTPDLVAVLGNRGFVPGFGNLLRKGGSAIDRGMEKLHEAGFLGPHEMGHDSFLLGILDAEFNNKVKRGQGAQLIAGRVDPEAEAHYFESELRGRLERAGYDLPKDIPPDTLAAVRRRVAEGEEMEDAYERALMYDEAPSRRADVAARPDEEEAPFLEDAGPAPGGGGEPAPVRARPGDDGSRAGVGADAGGPGGAVRGLPGDQDQRLRGAAEGRAQRELEAGRPIVVDDLPLPPTPGVTKNAGPLPSEIPAPSRPAMPPEVSEALWKALVDADAKRQPAAKAQAQIDYLRKAIDGQQANIDKYMRRNNPVEVERVRTLLAQTRERLAVAERELELLTAREAAEKAARQRLDEQMIETTAAGEQQLVPGVAPVTTRERLEAQGAKPMRGGQAGAAEGGLFDESARQQTAMEFGDPVKQQEAQRVLAEAGGDMEIMVVHEDGSVRKNLASRELDESADEHAAAMEMFDCAGGEPPADPEIPF